MLDCTCKKSKKKLEVREIIDIQLRIVENKRLDISFFSMAQLFAEDLASPSYSTF